MPSGSDRASDLIAQLGLQPHPERGYYAETYRATTMVDAPTHQDRRAASTAIYFLVTAEQAGTRLHRLKSDEIFHLYEGGPLDIVRLFASGESDVVRLGRDLETGERPQIVIPAGTWFGTELAPDAPYCLLGCTVAPGFDFHDFELADAVPLAEQYPRAAERIRRLLT